MLSPSDLNLSLDFISTEKVLPNSNVYSMLSDTAYGLTDTQQTTTISLTSVEAIETGVFLVEETEDDFDDLYDSNRSIDPLEDLAGNTIDTAREIAVSEAGNTYQDWVGSIDTVDYYGFSLDTSQTVNLSLDGLNADADVQLLDRNGYIIQSSTNAGTNPESIHKTLGAGTYYIRVTPFGNVDTPYNLELFVTPPIDDNIITVGTGGNPTGPIPSGGVALLGENPLNRFTLSGPSAAQATILQVPVEGQSFSDALRVQTNVRTTSDTAIVLNANTLESFKAGDTLFLRFYIRTIDTQDSSGRGRIRLTMDSAIWGQTITAGSEWTPWVLPVPARTGYAAGATRLRIGVGNTAPQTIEIGGLEVLNYGTQVQPYELPYSLRTYEGRQTDAAWREIAAENIDTYRKGDLTVIVTDINGTPIPDANVHVAMKRHAYSFGTAINENSLQPNSNSINSVLYRDNTLQLFNEAVIENGLKWNGWNSPTTRARSIEAVEWLRDNNLTVRGHTLVWPSWGNSPTSLKTQYDSILAQEGKETADAFLYDSIIAHIYEEAGYFKGQIKDWDVVNETYANNDFQRILGKSVLVDWFKAAHEADPDAILYLNENSIETGGTKTDFFLSEIQYLLDNGAPLGGIGMQGHIGAVSIPAFLSTLDRFAQFNLPIKITEFDILTPDEQFQADMTRDFMTAFFSHPSSAGFLMWGFWDGRHWLYDAPIYYRDWSIKPSGKAYMDLVFNEWWTDVESQADANGKYQVRGFLGEYEVTASKDCWSETVSTTLLRDGTTITIVL